MTKNILCGIYVTLSNNSQNFIVQVICFGLPIVTIILLQVSKTFQIQLHLKHVFNEIVYIWCFHYWQKQLAKKLLSEEPCYFVIYCFQELRIDLTFYHKHLKLATTVIKNFVSA